MESDIFRSRIWLDVTGLLLPLLVMASYVLELPWPVTGVLTALCVAGVYGPWLVTTDLRRWRAERVARLRALGRRQRDRSP